MINQKCCWVLCSWHHKNLLLWRVTKINCSHRIVSMTNSKFPLEMGEKFPKIVKPAVGVQLPSCVWLLVTPWTAACQAPLSSTISWNLLIFMSIESVMLSSQLILHHPLLHPQYFPASESLPVSWLFISGGQSFGASASVLPMNIQDWFPLGLTSLISLLFKGLLRVFSSTTIWKHQFFGAQPSLYSTIAMLIHYTQKFWGTEDKIRALCRGRFKRERHMYTYGWFMLMYGRNPHNIVK